LIEGRLASIHSKTSSVRGMTLTALGILVLFGDPIRGALDL
jgi:hypothetical protein